MFGKKEAPAAPNRYEVDAKFKSALRRIRKSCEEYDAKIEAEMQNAIRYRRAGNRDEEKRCMKKVSRYLASKIQKEEFYDNIERVQEKIDDIYDKLEVARTMKETYAGIDNLVDSKELKGIMKELDVFNKSFAKANNMMDAFMANMDESMNNSNVESSYSSTVQDMIDERMKSYEEKLEQEASSEEELVSGFSLQ